MVPIAEHVGTAGTGVLEGLYRVCVYDAARLRRLSACPSVCACPQGEVCFADRIQEVA